VSVRKLLREAYRSELDGLVIHMSRPLAWAAEELDPANPTRLYRRFVGWTFASGQVCRVCGKPRHDYTPGVPPRLIPCNGYAIEPIHRPGRS
jgi:hypothetical protein